MMNRPYKPLTLICALLILSVFATSCGIISAESKEGAEANSLREAAEMIESFTDNAAKKEDGAKKSEEITTPPPTTAGNDNTIGTEFKAAMDSYEKFMDEYVTFMKKYKASNGTDLSILTEYSKYMTQYADMVQNFDKWENDDLNAAEMAYYLQVQSRVTQKLLEVTQ